MRYTRPSTAHNSQSQICKRIFNGLADKSALIRRGYTGWGSGGHGRMGMDDRSVWGLFVNLPVDAVFA